MDTFSGYVQRDWREKVSNPSDDSRKETRQAEISSKIPEIHMAVAKWKPKLPVNSGFSIFFRVFTIDSTKFSFALWSAHVEHWRFFSEKKPCFDNKGFFARIPTDVLRLAAAQIGATFDAFGIT